MNQIATIKDYLNVVFSVAVIVLVAYMILGSSSQSTILGGASNACQTSYGALTYATTTVKNGTATRVYNDEGTGQCLRVSLTSGDVNCGLTTNSSSITTDANIQLRNPTSTTAKLGHDSFIELHGYRGAIWCNGTTTSTVNVGYN